MLAYTPFGVCSDLTTLWQVDRKKRSSIPDFKTAEIRDISLYFKGYNG